MDAVHTKLLFKKPFLKWVLPKAMAQERILLIKYLKGLLLAS